MRAPGERLRGSGCAVAFEDEDDLALAEEDVVSLEPQALNVEGRPLLDEPPSRLGRAPPDRNNDGNAGPRRLLGAEPSEQIGDLAEQANPAQGGDKHPLARVALEDKGLVAVDPFQRSAPDLYRRKLVEGDSESIGFARSVQDEVVVAEFELPLEVGPSPVRQTTAYSCGRSRTPRADKTAPFRCQSNSADALVGRPRTLQPRRGKVLISKAAAPRWSLWER